MLSVPRAYGTTDPCVRVRVRFPCAVHLRAKKNSCFDKKAATVPDCLTIKRI